MKQKFNAVAALFWAAAVIAAGISAYVIVVGNSQNKSNQGGDLLPAFTSRDQVREFLSNMNSYSPGTNSDYVLAPSSATRDTMEGSADAVFSSTNVQVAGVDEQDTVKTDGTYLYLASYNNVSIVRAIPPNDMKIISVIEAANLIGADAQNTSVYIDGIYLDQGKLIVIFSAYSWAPIAVASPDSPDVAVRIVDSMPRTIVAVVDVSDPSTPTLQSSFGVTGYALTTRMTGGVVYLVTQQYIWYYADDYYLPRVYAENGSTEVPVGDVHYDPNSSVANSYVNILAIDVSSLQSSVMSIVAGYSSTIYMSTDHLYLTFQKWAGDIVMLDGSVAPVESNSALTTIYRISVDGLSMNTTGKGDVTGWLLNQFSMDEKGSYLRVATTTDWSNSKNAVYVLDDQLDVVGALEGLAPGERIFSARFLDDTLYLVTFRQIDPLFVVDLTDPTNPKVVGQLEMPGFSSYLHPIDATHVLGIGSEGSNLKISLYDVGDPANPVEVDKYVFSADWSYSAAQYDHKAVLFDSDRGLLVLPVTLTWYTTVDPYNYTYETWNGFYVFTVSATAGLEVKGTVAHDDYAQRSAYIGDCLYTISTSMVKANSLIDLSELGSLQYQSIYWWGPIYYEDRNGGVAVPPEPVP